MNEMNSTISVLIPAYNTGKYIFECIESVIAQTYQNLEIIIVDDGSTDETADVASMFAKKDERIRLILTPHSGGASARNTCINCATGEYLIFVDSDDCIDETMCAKLYEKAKITKSDIVLTTMAIMNSSETLFGYDPELFRDIPVFNGRKLLSILVNKGSAYPMVSGNLYKSSFIRDNLLSFSGEYHEDEYFMPRSFIKANKISYCSGRFYLYRQRENSIMHSPSNIRKRAYSLYEISYGLKKWFDDIILDADFLIKETIQRHCWNLENRAKKLYEQYLYDSHKKCILIFSSDGIGGKYGIGTYVRMLRDCYDQDIWDVIIVNLYAQKTTPAFSMCHSSVTYSFCGFYANNFSELSNEQKNKYEKSVFYYLASRINIGREVFAHFNLPIGVDIIGLLKSKMAAIVIYTLHYTNWSFVLNGKISRIKQVLTSPRSKTDLLIKKEFELEKYFMINCCDQIIAIARHSKRMLVRLYGIPNRKISLIFNPYTDRITTRSTEKYIYLRKRYRISERDKVVLFVGRIDQVKGIFNLINAFKLLINDIPEAHLIIAGTGQMDKAMQESLDIFNRVHFVGFVGKEDLQSLYEIADLGVVPSLHEEFGYVLLEMISHGISVLSNKTGGLHEISNYFGIKDIDVDSPEKLYKAIKRQLLTDCSPKIRYLPSCFNFATFKNSLMDLLNNLSRKSK